MVLIKSALGALRLAASRATPSPPPRPIIIDRGWPRLQATRAAHSAPSSAPGGDLLSLHGGERESAMEERREFFGLKEMFSLEDMMEARVHFGHRDVLLNPHMRPYVFGRRLGVLIFDLEKTARLLELALLITAEIAYVNGIILFTHAGAQTSHLVEAAARDCGEYAYCRRWRNQVFSNSTKLFGAVTRLPDLVILFGAQSGPGQPHLAIKAAAKLLIPTVAICDTNVDPTLVTYPVPGNDDSPQAIEFYTRLFKEAVLKGKSKRAETVQETEEAPDSEEAPDGEEERQQQQ